MKLNETILNKTDKFNLIIILLFSIGLIYIKTKFFMSGAIYSPDKALYLINALAYSGMDYYNIVNPGDLFYSPIISFLTGILFKFGLVDQLAISLVSSFFALLGFIGMYFLLRIRFKPLLSLTGVIIYGSMSQLLINLSSGLLDVPSISISILIILFGIMAIDKNSKYFLIVFPLLSIGFFTRYTVGFIAPLLVLYYLMKRNFIENIDEILHNKSKLSLKLIDYFKSDEFKYILLSLIIGCILIFIICKYLIIDLGGSLTFIQQSQDTITNAGYGNGGIDVDYDKLFYIKNFSEILFDKTRYLDMTFSCILYLIIGCGMLLKFRNIVKNHSDYFKLKKNYWKTKNFKKLLIVLFIVMIAISFFSFKSFSSHMPTNICFLIAMIIFYSLTKDLNLDNDKNALTILFLSYFVINLVFMSIYRVKTFRYSIPLIPPFIYFVIYALEEILNYSSNKINCENKFLSPDTIIPIILIVIFCISGFSFIISMEISHNDNDLVNVTDYLMDIDPNYHEKSFGSNYRDSRIIRWYIKDNVTFNDDYESFDSSNISYIITSSKVDLENYSKMYNKGIYHIYHRN